MTKKTYGGVRPRIDAERTAVRKYCGKAAPVKHFFRQRTPRISGFSGTPPFRLFCHFPGSAAGGWPGAGQCLWACNIPPSPGPRGGCVPRYADQGFGTTSPAVGHVGDCTRGSVYHPVFGALWQHPGGPLFGPHLAPIWPKWYLWPKTAEKCVFALPVFRVILPPNKYMQDP